MATWKVQHLKAFSELKGKENVVYSVYWQLGSVNKLTELDNPSGDFIPFEKLTEDIVLSWVWNKIPKDLWEKHVAELEEKAKEPKLEAVSVPLPWV